MKSLGHLKYGRNYDKIYPATQFDIGSLENFRERI